MSDAQLLRVQCVTGALFGLFVLVHLANLAAAPLGADAYNSFQRAARAVYQFPLVEIGMLGVLLVHFACAILRIVRAGFRRRQQSRRARLHRYTGYFLMVVIVGHTAATRGVSLVIGSFPEFEGLSFSLWWMPAIFYPYYTLLALCGLFHAINGFVIASSVLGRPLPGVLRRGVGFWFATAAAALLMLAGTPALGGHLFPIEDPRDNDFARFYSELEAVDLGAESRSGESRGGGPGSGQIVGEFGRVATLLLGWLL